MSGSYYTLDAKYNTLLALIQANSGLNLEQILTNGNDAGGLSMTNINNVDLVNINGSAYPPSAPADNLTEVLTAGDDAGGLNITNLSNIALQTINNLSVVRPMISMTTGIVSPTYDNGVYYTSYAGIWNKATYLSPIHGAGITRIKQDTNNSFTGLYDIATGIITLPAGFTGFWSVEWGMALARNSPATTGFVAWLGSGASHAPFAGNNDANAGFLSSGSITSTLNQFNAVTLSGTIWATGGQSLAVWTNAVSQVNMGGDYSPAHFRVSFLGF